jgi:gas vesicle protein
MEYDQDHQVINFISGLLLGAIIGAGVAYLTAPQPGRKTRKRIRKAAGNIRESATDRLDDIADEVKGKVDEVMNVVRKSVVS